LAAALRIKEPYLLTVFRFHSGHPLLFTCLWLAQTIEQACVELAVRVFFRVENNNLSRENNSHVQHVKTIDVRLTAKLRHLIQIDQSINLNPQ
jgi:hypothetical protein